ncbi:MAG: AAA family ATPase, partial [Saprospiraceae bacterium]|nr:AAA family ATPase [Saprospiraceae bacterium]
LNLFTGANGVGKSSIIQALLLLRQSYEKMF